MANDEAAAACTLLEGEFSGRDSFQSLMRSAIAQAAVLGWREMIWCDLDFEDWPLGERAVIEHLQAWSHPGRKITLLAKRYDLLTTTHHRFVTWRKHWSHIVEARAVSSASEEELPSMIYAENNRSGWVMQRTQRQWCRGVAGSEPVRRSTAKEILHDWLAKSSESFPSTILGL